MKRKAKMSENTKKLSDRELCSMARQKLGVIDARVISPSDVVTAGWVRLKCQFGCGGYGGAFVCPPYTPTPDEMRKVLDTYRKAMLIHFTPEAEVKTIVVELEREIFLRGAWKALGLGAGPCYCCKECAVGKGACRYPEHARPAMEACGIDVFTTARKAGFPIEVIRTKHQCPNYYGLILVE